MKSLVAPGTTIEALEARIAPATFFVGSPTTFGFNDTNYDEAPFVNTEADPADPISGKVGGGVVGVADTFYLKLSAGDKVVLFTGSGFDEANPFITVKSGTVVAFFIDDPLWTWIRNEVQATELVGLSSARVFHRSGGSAGDVVTNLNAPHRPRHGGLLSKQTSPRSSGASVTGGIYSGGLITNGRFAATCSKSAERRPTARRPDFFPRCGAARNPQRPWRVKWVRRFPR